MPHKLIIFDWDGTLMDSGQKITRCFQSTARDMGLHPPEGGRISQYIGLSLQESWQRLYPEISGQTVRSLVERYRDYWIDLDSTPMPLFPGVQSDLECLNRAGFWLAVATGNSRAGLQSAIGESGLGQHFIYTRCADESRSKPHPQMLLDILAFTGLESSDAIMVGDTLFDLEMAKNVGMDALPVSYGHHARSQLMEFDDGA